LVCLWNYHWLLMPLSVVERHVEGVVTDFLWLDTPDPNGVEGARTPLLAATRSKMDYYWAPPGILEETWQHVLSVGRDRQCLLQTFARG